MFHSFQYEAEFYPELSRLPLDVRMKLDLAGIRLSLPQWLAFHMAERRVICHLPVENAEEVQTFTGYIDFLCRKYSGKAAETSPPVSRVLWHGAEIPAIVTEKSRDFGGIVSLDEWKGWQDCQRYALYKTAISRSEPEKFRAVLAELRGR